MKKKTVHEFYSILKEQNPNPKAELHYVNNYTLLVAVVLSAQATDIGVNKATRPLFRVVKSPEKMLQLGEKNLKAYIKTIGLYNGKAKNIISLSRILVQKFKG